MRPVVSCLLASSLLGACAGTASAQTPALNGEAYQRAVAASERTLQAWLRDADPKTTLMPDRVDGAGTRRHAAQLRRRPVSVPDPHRAPHRPGRSTTAG